MKSLNIEKIKLSTKEILLNLVDFSAIGMEAFFHRFPDVVDEVRQYKKDREIDKRNYYQKIWQLKKTGFIKEYKGGKDQPYVLTKKGKIEALKYLSGCLKIEKPKLWDRLWRIVIFDIPEDKKYLRDVMRLKLKQLGFYQLQKSVWVYPYQCREIIEALKYIYGLGSFLLFITANEVETDIDLVDYFLNEKILDIKMEFKS